MNETPQTRMFLTGDTEDSIGAVKETHQTNVKTQKVTGPGRKERNDKESLRFRGRAQSRWRRKSEKPGWSAGWTEES